MNEERKHILDGIAEHIMEHVDEAVLDDDNVGQVMGIQHGDHYIFISIGDGRSVTVINDVIITIAEALEIQVPALIRTHIATNVVELITESLLMQDLIRCVASDESGISIN
jgi:hypothetical protein